MLCGRRCAWGVFGANVELMFWMRGRRVIIVEGRRAGAKGKGTDPLLLLSRSLLPNPSCAAPPAYNEANPSPFCHDPRFRSSHGCAVFDVGEDGVRLLKDVIAAYRTVNGEVKIGET